MHYIVRLKSKAVPKFQLQTFPHLRTWMNCRYWTRNTRTWRSTTSSTPSTRPPLPRLLPPVSRNTKICRTDKPESWNSINDINNCNNRIKAWTTRCSSASASGFLRSGQKREQEEFEKRETREQKFFGRHLEPVRTGLQFAGKGQKASQRRRPQHLSPNGRRALRRRQGRRDKNVAIVCDFNFSVEDNIESSGNF